MILPSLASIVAASAAVKAIIGTSPVRFYPLGAAPQGVAAPYVTQQVIDSAPENTLSELPATDATRVQLSCWSDNTGTGVTSVQALALALRDAIEPYHHILAIRDLGRDFETQRWRIDIDVQVWNHRTAFVADAITWLSLGSPDELLELSGDMSDGDDLLVI